jgi:hypothetical protein
MKNRQVAFPLSMQSPYKGGPTSVAKKDTNSMGRCHDWQSFPCCCDVDERCPMCWKRWFELSKACNRGASSHFEAQRGLSKATPWTQNILAQGQSEAHGESKLYNTIVGVRAGLNLK